MCLRIFGYMPELAAKDSPARPPETAADRRARFGFNRKIRTAEEKEAMRPTFIRNVGGGFGRYRCHCGQLFDAEIVRVDRGNRSTCGCRFKDRED